MAVPAALLTAVIFWTQGDSWGRWLGLAFSVLLALGGMISRETRIFADRGEVERAWMLLGVFTLRHRVFPRGEFARVAWRFVPGDGHADRHMWQVGLERGDRTFLLVQSFDAARGSECPEARRFARELAGLTGVPLASEIERAGVSSRA
jgi:hypothetical protein